MKIAALVLIFSSLLLNACSTPPTLSSTEVSRQNAIDQAVSNILFDHDIIDASSYLIKRNNHVIINFASSVSENAYVTTIEAMRKNHMINGVTATQDGVSVCDLP